MSKQRKRKMRQTDKESGCLDMRGLDEFIHFCRISFLKNFNCLGICQLIDFFAQRYFIISLLLNKLNIFIIFGKNSPQFHFCYM